MRLTLGSKARDSSLSVGRRIRKHANPFNVATRVGRLDRMALFGRIAPLEVDVGCGAGHFLLQRARTEPEVDFIGFEIRKPLVEEANARAAAEGLRNLVYIYANAQENMGFAAPGEVLRFSIQFPDPCFKRRHWKRRILQPPFVRKMAELLAVGGEIFVQTDVRPLAEEMFEMLSAERALAARSSSPTSNLLDAASGLGTASPVPARAPAKTEWERHHEHEGEPIFRMRFEKVREPEGPIPGVPFRDTNPRRLKAETGHPEEGSTTDPNEPTKAPRGPRSAQAEPPLEANRKPV